MMTIALTIIVIGGLLMALDAIRPRPATLLVLLLAAALFVLLLMVLFKLV
jgi:hypothetical protein